MLVSLRRGLTSAREVLRTELWPIPVVAVVLAVVAGVLLPTLDGHVDKHLSAHVTTYLFGGGVEAARKILSAIAGSLITVTSLTFSLTVVTLQLASSQFSPRLLRTFTRDRFVHFTLALFLATFSFALTVLRTVRDADGKTPGFVPQISITIAFVLAVASVLALVLFLAHLAREIRVETTLRNVHREASETVRRTLSPRSDERTEALPTPPADAVPLLAPDSGFLLEVDAQRLLTAALEHDAVVHLARCPGDALVVGTPVGRAWCYGGPLSVAAREDLQRRFDECLTTGYERNESQDIAYGLRQLTDVASKALSPGINDPTTAVHALGHSAGLLCELAERELGPHVLRGEGTAGDGPTADAVRVVLDRPDFGGLLELAVTQPRRYGAGDPLVLARIAALLSELAWRSRGQQPTISAQLARLRQTIDAQDFDDTERARLAGLTTDVDAALAGRF